MADQYGVFWSPSGSGKSSLLADLVRRASINQEVLVVCESRAQTYSFANRLWANDDSTNSANYPITTLSKIETHSQHTDFDSLALATKENVLRTVCGLLGGQRWDLAEEVVQAALVVVWQRMSKPDGLEYPEAYAKKVAVRLALKYLAAERRMQPTDVFDDEEDERESNKFRLADMRLDLDRAIKALPPRMRAILRQHLAGKSYKEIATFFKINEGTVGAQLSQARKRLRLSLDGWAGR